MNGFVIEVEALPGYTLDTYTIDGKTVNYNVVGLSYLEGEGYEHWRFGSTGNYKAFIFATATKDNSNDDIISKTIKQDYATIIGQKERTNATGDGTSINDSTYSYDDSCGVLHNKDSLEQNIAIIKFVSPKFKGVSTSIYVGLTFSYDNSRSYNKLNLTLCSSDEYYSSYFYDGSNNWSLKDPTMINTVTTIKTTGDGGNYIWVEIPATSINSEQEYYLVVWIPENLPDSVNETTSLLKASGHSVIVNYIDSIPVYICDDSQNFNSYQCCIDNGTTWEEYVPYIDNGINWELL